MCSSLTVMAKYGKFGTSLLAPFGCHDKWTCGRQLVYSTTSPCTYYPLLTTRSDSSVISTKYLLVLSKLEQNSSVIKIAAVISSHN